MKEGLSRRSLFKYMAVSGAVATVASCQNKPEKLIPLLVPPDNSDYIPHAALNYMTTCRECEAGCGLMVTAREGRAQKAEGNPLHPLNRGALCARGQASMQALYHPNRLKNPLLRNEKIDWEQAETAFAKMIQESQRHILYVGKPASGSEGAFIEQWLTAIGGGKRLSLQTFSRANEIKANQAAFGKADIPVYAFEKAKYLLNFSSDFLETWGNPVENALRFTEMHAYKKGSKNKFVHVGPHVSLTGAKADEWVNINPGTEGWLALALAQVIRKAKNNYPFLAAILDNYTPAVVASKVGISAAKIEELAKEFRESSPSLAIGGGNLVNSDQGTNTLLAINLLNAVAGNLGETVQFMEQAEPAVAANQTVLQELKSGKIKLLILDDVNPEFVFPTSAGSREAIKNIPNIVVFSATTNEATHLGSLVLPILTPYESWGDAFPRAGIRSIQQPVMAPVKGFDAKARENILLNVAKRINAAAFSEINTYLDHLKMVWKGFHAASGSTELFDSFWITVLENGGLFTPATPAAVAVKADLAPIQMADIKLDGVDGLALLPSTSLLLGDGSGANKPWLQEVPDPMSQIVWDSWLEIHPETAKRLKIKDRSLVEVTTKAGVIKAVTAYYHFGINQNAIAIPMGQGHTHSGDIADNFGVNVLTLLGTDIDSSSGDYTRVNSKALLRPLTELSYTVNLDGNARQLGRNIAAAATITELAHGGEPHGEHQRRTEFYPERQETAGYYQPYRWGMVIDLDKCTGCSACTVACYAENNIPVVGKERTGIGREMSWLRLERYIEGYGDDFEVRFTPMLCQHCGNAGCEPVCPVYATYHNPEGLNAQIYNRCVGTRYCSNNCAYKARRFNWFDYQFTEPLDQQLNSTITTRNVGVMEKCTFCVQRIKAAEDDAKEFNRDVQDGEIMTACQQTCPAQAITFGNLEDRQSKVARLSQRHNQEKRDRQYEILSELNYKPAITYLKKVNLEETISVEHKTDSSHGLNIPHNTTQEA